MDYNKELFNILYAQRDGNFKHALFKNRSDLRSYEEFLAGKKKYFFINKHILYRDQEKEAAAKEELRKSLAEKNENEEVDQKIVDSLFNDTYDLDMDEYFIGGTLVMIIDDWMYEYDNTKNQSPVYFNKRESENEMDLSELKDKIKSKDPTGKWDLDIHGRMSINKIVFTESEKLKKQIKRQSLFYKLKKKLTFRRFLSQRNQPTSTPKNVPAPAPVIVVEPPAQEPSDVTVNVIN